MPHLVKWNYEMKDYGLVVVGLHVSQGSPEQIDSKARSLGVNFTIVSGGRVKDGDFKGIPHCMLFDHTGKCLYRGDPTAVETKLRSAVGAAIVAGMESPPTSKGVTPLADSLKKGQSPMVILPKAVALLKSTDSQTAEEAKQLVGKLTDVGQKKVDQAESVMKDDPVAAFLQLEPVPSSFKGTPVGTKATSLLAELKKDKKVASEMKARPSLAGIKKIDAQLSPLAQKVPPSDPTFQKLAKAADQAQERLDDHEEVLPRRQGHRGGTRHR